MKRVDVFAWVKKDEENTEKLKAVVSELGIEWDGDSTRSESYLPKSNRSAYYAQFHAFTDSKARDIDIHLHYRTQPNSSPPRELKEKKAAGSTLDKVESALAKDFPRPMAIVETKLTIPAIHTPKMPSAGGSLEIDGRSFLVSGGAYTAERHSEGLSSFAWLERGNEIQITITHIPSEFSWTKIWEEEKRRCLQHLLTVAR